MADLPLLSPEEAVRIGLKNNFSLSLARDQADLATLNRQTGVGPFLPTASASASHSGEFDGDTDPRTTIGAGVNLQIFNGFQSWFAYRRLQAQENAAALRERIAVEAAIEEILGSYYGIVLQKRQLEAIREMLEVSAERARLSQARHEVGAGSRLEQLQSLADLNADSSALMNGEIALREAMIRLNLQMGRSAEILFDVPDSIPVESGLPVESLRAGIPERNPVLLEARTQRIASELSLNEARGLRLPAVQGGVSYSTAPDALNASPVTGTDRIQYSVGVSVPLFDGLRARQATGGARIQLRQQETVLRQREYEVLADFAEAEARYLSGLRQIGLEERNLEVAILQAEAARERFQVGASSPLEFRDAQRRLLDAHSRLASARRSAKQSELALKRLAGVLAAPVPHSQETVE